MVGIGWCQTDAAVDIAVTAAHICMNNKLNFPLFAFAAGEQTHLVAAVQ